MVIVVLSPVSAALATVLAAFLSGIAVSDAMIAFGFVHRPGGDLDIHREPRPPAGGLLLAFSLALYVFLIPSPDGWSVYAASLIFLSIGTLDDYLKTGLHFRTRPLLPVHTIILEVLGAGSAGILTGITHSPVEIGILIVWTVIVVNGINMLDGMDGLMGLVVLVGTIFLWTGDQAGPELFPGLVCGLTGLLVLNLWNAGKPRLLAGNSGTLMIGGYIAFATYPYIASGGVKTLRIILILAVPLFEVVYNTFRRVLGGIPPWKGDLKHPYNVMAERWKNNAIPVILYTLIALLTGFLAMSINWLVPQWR
jgi:UDP-GlcNAc:undecaprenyl-phosphate GlcNAc-1-phosphate transferase